MHFLIDRHHTSFFFEKKKKNWKIDFFKDKNLQQFLSLVLKTKNLAYIFFVYTWMSEIVSHAKREMKHALNVHIPIPKWAGSGITHAGPWVAGSGASFTAFGLLVKGTLREGALLL